MLLAQAFDTSEVARVEDDAGNAKHRGLDHCYRHLFHPANFQLYTRHRPERDIYSACAAVVIRTSVLMTTGGL